MLLGLCTRTGASGDTQRATRNHSLGFQRRGGPLCFAFKTSYPTTAPHISPRSLCQTEISSRCLWNTHQEQSRNHQAPSVWLPSFQQAVFQGLIKLLVASNHYTWELLPEVFVMSLSHLFLGERLHPLGNKSYGLEQVGCNIYPSFPNFA